MMYKLILVASAVNAAEEHENTATLVNNLCSLIDFAPDAVPMLLGQLSKTYAPEAVSKFVGTKDLGIGNSVVHQLCSDYKAGSSVMDSIKNQKDIVIKEGASTIVEKGAAIALGEDSALAQAAGKFTTAYAAGELDSQVQKAKAFVDVIVKAEEDKNTPFSFSQILNKADATRMRETLNRVELELKKAEKNEQKTIECGTAIYKDLKDLVKNGLYDELLDKSSSILGVGADTSQINQMVQKVLVRTTVSKAVGFLGDCTERRILLA